MVDLMERLRSLSEVEAHTSACSATCTCGHIPNLYRTVREASAEIERLRAALGTIAERDSDGLESYTSQAMRHIAHEAIERGRSLA
jgi:hypothetical protein